MDPIYAQQRKVAVRGYKVTEYDKIKKMRVEDPTAYRQRQDAINETQRARRAKQPGYAKAYNDRSRKRGRMMRISVNFLPSGRRVLMRSTRTRSEERNEDVQMGKIFKSTFGVDVAIICYSCNQGRADGSIIWHCSGYLADQHYCTIMD
jgi:hypothetical protein